MEAERRRKREAGGVLCVTSSQSVRLTRLDLAPPSARCPQPQNAHSHTHTHCTTLALTTPTVLSQHPAWARGAWFQRGVPHSCRPPTPPPLPPSGTNIRDVRPGGGGRRKVSGRPAKERCCCATPRTPLAPSIPIPHLTSPCRITHRTVHVHGITRYPLTTHAMGGEGGNLRSGELGVETEGALRALGLESPDRLPREVCLGLRQPCTDV